MGKLDTTAYKVALGTGVPSAIIAEARALVRAVGKTPLAADKPNVNASHGDDNTPEKNRYQLQFEKQAFAITASADGYNDKLAAGADPGVEAAGLVERVQALESSQAALLEIERIDKGDSFGTGGGFTEKKIGEPEWVFRLESKIDKLLAKGGA